MTYLGTDAPDRALRLDLRLCLPALATWLSATVLLGTSRMVAGGTGLVAGALALALACALRRTHTREAAAPLLAALVCVAAGSIAVAGRLGAVESGPVARLAAEERRVTMVAEVVLDPRPRSGASRSGHARYAIEAESVWVAVNGEPVRTRVPVVVLAAGDQWRALLPSQRVRLSGRLVPGGVGASAAALVLVRGPPEVRTPPNPAQAFAGMVRRDLRLACEPLPPAVGGLLPAIVVGDTSSIPQHVIDDFETTGMSHLLAVSGANLAIVTGAVAAAGRALRLPPWLRAAIGMAVLLVFVLIARPEPSVLRAAVMGSIALLALALGRQRTGVAALSAAVLGLVLFDPQLARSYGFALSVLATAGIVVFVPRWRERWAARMPRWLAETIAVPLAAQLACAPLLVLLTAQVSLVALPANLLATPIIAPATILGFLVAALAPASVAAAQVLAWLPGALIGGIVVVAEYGARVPAGTLAWPGHWGGAVLLAALILLALIARGRPARLLAVAGAAALATVLALQYIAPAWPPRGWMLVACDVGQGDALVLRTGDASGVVIDTGVEPSGVRRCLDGLGIAEVSLLVLTHDDNDHIGGVRGVLRHRSVHAVLVPEGFAAPEVVGVLDRAGMPVRVAVADRRFAVGRWRFTVLWPPRGHRMESNNASLVLHAQVAASDGADAMSVLLTGDIEGPAQRALLGTAGVRNGVDVLKTPHHGSRDQEPAFLAASDPRVTLTSVGADNDYGHPAPATWALLNTLTPRNYRTDLHGHIAVWPTGDRIAVLTRGPPDR